MKIVSIVKKALKDHQIFRSSNIQNNLGQEKREEGPRKYNIKQGFNKSLSTIKSDQLILRTLASYIILSSFCTVSAKQYQEKKNCF